MTTKHFVTLAAEIAALKVPEHDYGGDKQVQAVAEDMRCCLARRVASVCQAHNPNFDRSRFLRACEVDA